MSNYEINTILSKEKNYKGTFMLDEKLPKGKGVYVLNLDKTTGPGTHWVAVYEDEYYDSFGLPPPNKLKHLQTVNTIQNQARDSMLCGFYACSYILLRKIYSPYKICYVLFKNNSKINGINILSQVQEENTNIERNDKSNQK